MVRTAHFAVAAVGVAGAVGAWLLLGREPAPAPPPPRASQAAPPPRADAGLPPAARAPEAGADLPVRLIATLVRSDPRDSLAALEPRSGGGHQLVAPGESIPGHPQARILEIEPGRVLVDNDGVPELLLRERSESPEVAAFYEALRNTPPRALEPAERERRRALAERLRALGETAAAPRRRRVGGLLAQADVRTVYEDGELRGIALDRVAAGSLYERVGLRAGDLVTGLNGVPLAGDEAAALLISQLALSDVLEVSVERSDGAADLVSIPTSDLFEELETLPLEPGDEAPGASDTADRQPPG